MPGFVTDAAVTTALELINKSVPTKLPGWAVGMVPQANVRAYAEIKRALVGRGFTLAQINAWDDGAEFQTDIAMWWAVTGGASLQNGNSRWVDKFDRRKELLTIPFLVGGVLTEPINQDTVGVGTGPLDTSQDEFVLDSGDSRLGQPTVF